MSETGIVFNIQRFSIHDGPGIRTTVFCKGCNLHCAWCHNPESMDARPEIQLFENKCIGCGLCFEKCPQHAHSITESGRLFDRTLCVRCGEVEAECPAAALEVCGKTMTAEEVVDEIMRDEPFYQTSGGGATFSGGEALLQKDFIKSATALCKEKGLHVALDTAGALPYEYYQAVLPTVDLFLYDLKIMDPQKHRHYTGVDNARIHENLKKLAKEAKEIWIRIPIIPTVNDCEEEMLKMAALVKEAGGSITRIELLPYHRLGEGKYGSLGKQAPGLNIEPPAKEHMDQLTACFADCGIPATHS